MMRCACAVLFTGVLQRAFQFTDEEAGVKSLLTCYYMGPVTYLLPKSIGLSHIKAVKSLV